MANNIFIPTQCEIMIVSIEHSKLHSKYKKCANFKLITSINLHTSSFDNASHDDKPSGISHNLYIFELTFRIYFHVKIY